MVGPRSLRAWARDLEVSPARFGLLACWTLGVLAAVVVSGAFVRLTASGLGCENWPRCGDTPFPALEYHAAIEFGNRVVALVGIVLTVVTWWTARKVPGLPRWVSRVGLLAAAGTIGQIPLGGVTVLTDLHPIAVMSHFFLALIVVLAAVVVAVEARRLAAGEEPAQLDSVPLRRLAQLSALLLPLLALLIVTGSLVTAAGPHSGGSDIARLGNLEDAMYVHVRVSGVFGIAYLGLVLGLLRYRALARRETVASVAILGVLVAQMVVGEVQWRNELPWEVVLAHVGLFTLVFAGFAWLSARLVWTTGVLRRGPAALRTAQ
ncbi:MAG: COX15/CtaA family protein [Thermoleophilia bacterium]